MDNWKEQTLTLGTVTISVRFVSQRRRNEIGRLATQRTGEMDFDRYADLFARDAIGGWSEFRPLDALGFGYEDFETLPIGEDGCVPFSPETASLLYRECLVGAFRNQIDATCNAIASEVAHAKKKAAA